MHWVSPVMFKLNCDLQRISGSTSTIDLPVLHDFGDVGVKNDARSPFMKRYEPDTDQPPHIVPGKTSIRLGIHGHISQYRKPYLLFLACEGISDILNLSAPVYSCFFCDTLHFGTYNIPKVLIPGPV